MVVLLKWAFCRVAKSLSGLRCWMLLRPRVSGRIKLRGNTRRILVDRSFRCDGDLWLGVYSDDGTIVIEAGVSASGPLVVTAIGSLRIGADTLLGPNVLVTDHYHGDPHNPLHRALPPSHRPLFSRGNIVIGNGSQLGANCVVLGPATIGDYTIVGANAVVKGDVAPRSIYTGIDAARSLRDHAAAKEFKD